MNVKTEVKSIYPFEKLKEILKGDLYTDDPMRLLYATDASAYKEMPLAVARPKDKDDIKALIAFAREHRITIIPRTAGTSLAGQVVGNGIVVDVSKYMTSILEVNKEEKWVRVQPGVVLDELNIFLEPYGLFFGPETSTANRCMMGGMLGNNACGAHSLIYGSTRDHTLEVQTILSDGSEVHFSPLTRAEFEKKRNGNKLENKIYNHIHEILADESNQQEIRAEFPDPAVKRRNTGYAIDQLLETEPFTETINKFNFSKLLAGSEGTLAFTTEIKLNLVDLPPKTKGLICAHFHTLEEAMQANLIALKHNPGAVELIDKVIMDLTKENIEQRKNRFFIDGEPGAILVIEFARETKEEIEKLKEAVEAAMRAAGYGYHFPLIFGPDIKKVWALRKSGLGLLSNVPGDAKPVSVVEDTSVRPDLLPEYIADFKKMLAEYDLSCVYHAHIATGELHLRPVLNLKDPKDVELFRTVASRTAELVKKYRGSLSGEHGDGRLRGEFIPVIIGEKNFELVKQIKQTWDPDNVFNANKIVNTPSMNSSLRYTPGAAIKEIETIFDFPESQGILRMAEKCNGSGDCRKSATIGGTMCPSFMATRDENTTTRARANTLREFLTNSTKKNPFDHKEIKEVLDLCLSCKGCKSECPSNVDMAKLKAEFLQHYYDANGVPFRSLMIAYISKLNALAAIVPGIYNSMMKSRVIAGSFKKMTGFAVKRSMPLLYKTTLRRWGRKNLPKLNGALAQDAKTVYLFADEFTNYNDTLTGIRAATLLNRLGYKVLIPDHAESGRAFLSKGLLRKARKLADTNVSKLSPIVSAESPLIGIEPSAILAFRDEYPDLLRGEMKEKATQLATNSLMFDEFIAREMEAGKIDVSVFTDQPKEILLHGHCQQKSVASTVTTKKVLSLPLNYTVKEINSGCCGMAGSFGYEKEHYDLSMKVGELVLFPAVRQAGENVIISAPGTSCRHQIKDGTDVQALHPVDVLYEALK